MKQYNKTLVAGLAAMSVLGGVAIPVAAQAGSSIETFIDESEGYVPVRPNVLLVEGTGDIRLCHFSVSEDFFRNFESEGTQQEEKPGIVCAPLQVMEVAGDAPGINGPIDLANFIDNSVAYTELAPNIMMIEGEFEINVCHFDIRDAFFEAIRSEDTSAMIAARPKITCVPFSEINN